MTPDQFLTLFRDFTHSRERYYTPKIQKALDKQVEAYFNNRPVDADLIYVLLRALYWDAATKYSRRMKRSFKTIRAQKADGQWGFLGEFAESFKRFFDLTIRNLSYEITETTLKSIQAFIKKKIEEGFSLPEVGKQLEDLLKVNKMRAMRIARTETTTSANAAAFFAAMNEDYYMTKEWLAADDSRTRRTHGHAGVNGTKVNLEDPFKVGNSLLMYPGDRGGDGRLPPEPGEVINCRCTLVYRARRDEKGRIMMKEK